MTDPTNTPPTVGQPPVAEGEQFAHLDDDHLIDELGMAWEASPGTIGPELDYLWTVRRELSRRLTQARSAPPSEGMVLVSDALAAIGSEIDDASRYALKDHRTPNGAWDDESWVEDLRNGIERALTALAAPSGGPDE